MPICNIPIKGGSEIAEGQTVADADFGVQAPDDKTVVITLEGPTPFFLQALTHYTAYPLPEHVIEEFGDDWTNVEHIVGNGPLQDHRMGAGQLYQVGQVRHLLR